MNGKTIRAALCAKPGADMVIGQLRLADPGPGEVLIAIKACAICQSDLSYMDGHWGGFENAVFGHEAAGIVEKTGPGVGHVAAGDHVLITLIRACGDCRHCKDGSPPMCDAAPTIGPLSPLEFADGTPALQAMKTAAFADNVTVHGSQVVKIPKDIDFAPASTIACAVITGYGAVIRDGQTRLNDRVVVIGAGGVGLNIIQTARLRGAGEIIAIDREPEKLEDAQRFGATHLIDATTMDVADRVRFATGGQGADQVYVSVGVQAAIDQGLGLLAKSGSLVIVGIPADGAMTTFDTVGLNSFNQRIIGSKMGSARIQTDVPEIVDHYRHGRFMLDELVAGRFALDDINEAIAASRSGKTVRNVIMPGR